MKNKPNYHFRRQKVKKQFDKKIDISNLVKSRINDLFSTKIKHFYRNLHHISALNKVKKKHKSPIKKTKITRTKKKI